MNNDRFKFRVWDIENECYQQEDAEWCYLKHDGRLDCGCASDYDTVPEWHFKQENAVIEQCTGIKDTNGKLIFENDNVSTRTISGKRGTVVWTADSSFRIHCSDGDFLNIKMTDTIIGNIHEVKNEQ